MFEKDKKEIDFALDTLAMKAYDAGYNAVVDSLHTYIEVCEKHGRYGSAAEVRQVIKYLVGDDQNA
jgi:hypothetical protein